MLNNQSKLIRDIQAKEILYRYTAIHMVMVKNEWEETGDIKWGGKGILMIYKAADTAKGIRIEPN